MHILVLQSLHMSKTSLDFQTVQQAECAFIRQDTYNKVVDFKPPEMISLNILKDANNFTSN